VDIAAAQYQALPDKHTTPDMPELQSRHVRGRTIYAVPDRVVYGYFDMLTRLLVEAGRWDEAVKIPLLVSSRDFIAVKLQWEAKAAAVRRDPTTANAAAAKLVTLSQEPGQHPFAKLIITLQAKEAQAFAAEAAGDADNAVMRLKEAVAIEDSISARAEVLVQAELEWRRVLGAFQLTIPVRNKEVLLVPEERDLSVLRWIAEFIPRHNRWHPVFHRYLSQIAGRVSTFGGDPGPILPSPTGDGRRKHPRHPEPQGEARLRFTGKIAGLIFDGFGDFEGFLLDTEDGERKFYCREKEIEELAEQAWRERLRITVLTERHEPHRPLSIIIRQPPAPFWH
jgi:hypothetical protein